MTIRYALLIKNPFVLILLLSLSLSFLFEGCKKKARSDMGNVLYLKTKNKIFKDVVPDSFAVVFQKELELQQSKINNAGVITAYYKAHDYDPVLVMDHFPNDDIRSVTGFFQKVNQHGLDPKLFQSAEIDTLLSKFYKPKGIKNLSDAYSDMAKLEIMLANSLINYSNDIQFGIVNPRKTFSRYFTQTRRPDSTDMYKIFKTASFKNYLDSIQPKDQQYIALQKAYAEGYTAPGISKEETRLILMVNLERLRWKNKPSEDRYVIVNIPDFRLDMMNAGKSELTMKVCVGEGRNKDYSSTLINYPDSDKTDRPFIRETPQLNSMINEAQVNPIWNIPQSIASKEIIVEAQKDPYYLSNKNINVYKKGKLIEDSETIHWDENSAKEYSFKQQPGDDNSLGKIKFLFPNGSNVYLHDTPAKEPFRRSMRAVSHGCVRLEKPLDFARALFGEDSDEFKVITEDMTDDKTKPTDLSLPKKMPVYITYVTCWVDANGRLQFRGDVYGLDIVLYNHLQKFIKA